MSKCPYCDFNSHVASKINHKGWKEAYLKELDYFRPLLAGKNIQSIFFGGGTPSLMEPELVKSIIEAISIYARLDKSIEITLEANPTSVEAKKFKDFKLAGINRVSIGVQSFKLNNLRFLGRTHDVESAKEAIFLAREIFPRFSFDLIYSLPGQNLDDWSQEINEAMIEVKDHISLYQLTIEKGTLFFSDYHKGKLVMLDDSIAAKLYNWTNNYLSNLNYNKYEISNYSKIGQECRHNLNYWNYSSYLGIGPGAHSRLVCKSNNIRKVIAIMMLHNPQKWLNKTLYERHGMQALTILNNQEVIEEIIMVGLRLSAGITDHRLLELTNCNFKTSLNIKYVEQLVDDGYLVLTKNNIKLTNKGVLFYNYIVPRIISDNIIEK